MALFRRHRDSGAASEDPHAHTVDGLDAWAEAQGWQPASVKPFGGHIEGEIHEIARVMYGVPRVGPLADSVVGPTEFGDKYRGTVDGRSVTIADGFTYMQSVTT